MKATFLVARVLADAVGALIEESEACPGSPELLLALRLKACPDPLHASSLVGGLLV